MAGLVMMTRGGGGACGGKADKTHHHHQQEQQLSLLAVLMAAIRKSLVSCRIERRDHHHHHHHNNNIHGSLHHYHVEMEIGWPTDVQHITHVTFDRFNGFLGLPLEFEVEVPSRVPSASASVFGVSAESMQCCYDSKGNSVPTILFLMQERLYSQGGLKAEGIFRINPENSQEEHVRNQLNRGIVPDDIDVHCLAGLIKAWFRELPSGVLDGLSPDVVLQCNTEEESLELVKQLKPTESALLNWAVELMADVVEEEDLNKMNARNIAMVFAPNMTKMSDPLTALMHAVQVMNLLKTLIIKTLRERDEAESGGYSPASSHLSGRQASGDYGCQQEMDTSSELGRASMDCDDKDQDLYSPTIEDFDGDEAESLSEIEDCFLSRLEQDQNVTECASSRSLSGLKMGPLVSFSELTETNSKNSDPVTRAEDVFSLIASRQRSENTGDMQMAVIT